MAFSRMLASVKTSSTCDSSGFDIRSISTDAASLVFSDETTVTFVSSPAWMPEAMRGASAPPTMSTVELEYEKERDTSIE